MTGPFVSLGAPPEYIESLNRKKEIIVRLCAALHEFLTGDIDHIIEQVNRKPPKMPRPTIEDLNRAQEDVDMMERQIDALKRLGEEMPEKMQAAYIDAQLPALERLVQPARDRVAFIQKAMEEPEPDPSNPWDGSHRITTLCAVCAAPYGGTESSIPKLKVALKSAGWGRDIDGDHICPACAAAALSNGPTPTEACNQQKGDPT